MSIFIISNVKSKFAKIYFLNSKNRRFVDKKFDFLHQQNKLNWINDSTFYAFSCFVIWKTIHTLNKSSKRKNKMIIDIKNFNKIFMFDAYSMTLQIDVITTVFDCFFISIMNCASFFHQWLVQLTNRYKLIVVNYWKSKQWNVVVMKYRNSQIYVQKQIDKLLYEYKHFVKTYVDDVIIFF